MAAKITVMAAMHKKINIAEIAKKPFMPEMAKIIFVQLGQV